MKTIVIGEDDQRLSRQTTRERDKGVIQFKWGCWFELQKSTTPLLWPAMAVRWVLWSEVPRLCNESFASSLYDCEIRTNQRKFDDDCDGSMKMLFPIATILIDEDARSNSMLAFVYWWWRQFSVLGFFIEKRVKLLFGEKRVKFH